ncbi:DUF6541 family protein [Kocuria sp. M1N1S27]
MLTAWMPYLPAFLVLLAVLWLPGLALLWAFGERSGRTLLAAPAFSVAVVGLSGVVLDLLGIRYGLASQAGAVAVLAVLAWVVGRLLPGPGRTGPRGQGARSAEDARDDAELEHVDRRPWLFPLGAAAGLVVGGTFLLRRMMSVIGGPEALAQRWDNIFHLNAVRWIFETGSGSTLTLNRMMEPDRAIALYPAAWHQLASLVVPLTGENVMVAQNLTLLAVAGLVWPASCVYLVRVLVGPSPVAAAVAGIASAGFGLFPFGLMTFGPLFPNILGLAVLPVALGLMVRPFGPALTGNPVDAPLRGMRLVRLLACFVVALGALLVSQPNTVLALLVVAVPLLVTAFARSLRSSLSTGRRARAGRLVAVAVGAAVLWLLLWSTLTTEFWWAPGGTFAQALGEGLFYGTDGRVDVPWVLVVLTATGVYAAFSRRQLRWLVLAHLLFVYLYATAAAGEDGPWRQWLTAGWYTDSYRLAATLPLTGVPLIALGAAHLVRAAAAWTARTSAGTRRQGVGAAAYPVAAVVLLALVAPLSQVAALTGTTSEAKGHYDWEGPDNLLSQDEYELLQDLDELTDAGDVIAVNPWNGGSLAYAVADRPVTQYHIGTPGPVLEDLVTGVDDAAPGSAACTAVEELGVDYVLDFGSQFIIPDEKRALGYTALNSVDDLEDTSNLVLVERNGEAALYEIVGCETP